MDRIVLNERVKMFFCVTAIVDKVLANKQTKNKAVLHRTRK